VWSTRLKTHLLSTTLLLVILPPLSDVDLNSMSACARIISSVLFRSAQVECELESDNYRQQSCKASQLSGIPTGLVVAPAERNEGLLFTVVTEHCKQQLRMMWAVVSPTLVVVN